MMSLNIADSSSVHATFLVYLDLLEGKLVKILKGSACETKNKLLKQQNSGFKRSAKKYLML